MFYIADIDTVRPHSEYERTLPESLTFDIKMLGKRKNVTLVFLWECKQNTGVHLRSIWISMHGIVLHSNLLIQCAMCNVHDPLYLHSKISWKYCAQIWEAFQSTKLSFIHHARTVIFNDVIYLRFGLFTNQILLMVSQK